MYASIHTRTYICIEFIYIVSIHLYTSIYRYTLTFSFTYMYIYTYICINIDTSISIGRCIWMYRECIQFIYSIGVYSYERVSAIT